MDELSEEDKLTVARARKMQRFLSQPFQVAEVFTGSPGKYVSLEDTIDGFRGILGGKYDDLPEMAFYMVRGRREGGREGARDGGREGWVQQAMHRPWWQVSGRRWWGRRVRRGLLVG
jgi:hypothetical protein